MKKGSQVPNSNLPVTVNHLVSGKCSELAQNVKSMLECVCTSMPYKFPPSQLVKHNIPCGIPSQNSQKA